MALCGGTARSSLYRPLALALRSCRGWLEANRRSGSGFEEPVFMLSRICLSWSDRTSSSRPFSPAPSRILSATMRTSLCDRDNSNETQAFLRLLLNSVRMRGVAVLFTHIISIEAPMVSGRTNATTCRPRGADTPANKVPNALRFAPSGLESILRVASEVF
eukprot:3197602-Rhodomonas_salina.1